MSVPSVDWMFSVCAQCWLDVQCLCPVLVGCSESMPSVGWMFSVCAQCWLDLCICHRVRHLVLMCVSSLSWEKNGKLTLFINLDDFFEGKP